MSNERVLDRLAKLLELAERGDENEAQVAAQRAAELMARHQLSVADVAARGSVAPTTEKDRR